MPTLRCERLGDGDVDRAIAGIGSATLARTPDGAFIEIADRDRPRAERLLAFAGVRATSVPRTLMPPPGTRPAVGRGLTPLPLGAVALDLVHVRTLPLGEESKRLLQRRAWRGPGAARRALVRDLLRGDQATMGWRRRAWTSREVLRSPEARATLRAVIFDVTAIGAPPEHRVLVGDGALVRWLFG